MDFPKLLTSDNGGEFRSQLDKVMMDMLGIKCHYTTPYHPQVLLVIIYTGIVYDNNILFNRQMALMNDGIKR